MSSYERGFELHLGFPTGDTAAALRLQPELKGGWSRSEVTDVVDDSSIFDPHNVPGVLGMLLSRDVPVRSDDELFEAFATAKEELQSALSSLSRANLLTPRVELEYVFGTAVAPLELSKAANSLRPLTVPDLSDADLSFRNAARIAETPVAEIHFVLDAFSNRKGLPELSCQAASGLFKQHGVGVRQTIRYRSQRMVQAGVVRRKIISTAYYSSPLEAEQEARRLLADVSLARACAEQGYQLELSLERIFACFKPVSG